MSPEFFKTQMDRLQKRFGAKAIDNEFTKLVWLDVDSMSESGFLRSVNIWIGNRSHLKPPLLSEFREARLNEEKYRLGNEAKGAADSMGNHPQMGLRAYLAKEFPGCKSLNEAIEVRALQIKVQKANDPNYEPMTDPKWMGTK